MIKIKIGDQDHYLKGEEKQWVIGRMRTQKPSEKNPTPEPTFVGESFYPSLKSAIEALLEKKLRAADVNNLTELQLALHRAKDELRGIYDTTI